MTETSQVHARHDTRQRIQSVALELFAEQGYDKTSLREIAERLDVTKAALYYHFKSKEDIVASLVEDYFGQMDDLIAWGRTQPRTAEARAQVLDRYYRIVAEGSGVFRMLQHNQASVNSLAHAKNRSELFRERMDALVGLLTEQDAAAGEPGPRRGRPGQRELRLHVLRRSHRRPGANCAPSCSTSPAGSAAPPRPARPGNGPAPPSPLLAATTPVGGGCARPSQIGAPPPAGGDVRTRGSTR